MTKKTNKLIIMAVSLILLAGIYFLCRTLLQDDGSKVNPPPADTGYSVGNVDTKTLTDVSVLRTVNDDGGKKTISFDFSLNESQTNWLWSEDKNVPLDNVSFAEMATAVSEIMSDYRLEGISESELAKYGLDAPELELSFTDGKGAHKFYVGAHNSFGDTDYLCTEDKTTVYAVPSELAEKFRFDIFDIIDKDDAPALTEAVITSFEYSLGDRKLHFNHYPSGKDSAYSGAYKWYLSINDGAEFAVSEAVGKALTDTLTTLNFSSCVAYNNSKDADFGLDRPASVIVGYNKTENIQDQSTGSSKTITTAEKLTLAIGKNSDGVYFVRPNNSVLTTQLSLSEAFTALFDADERYFHPSELISLDMPRISLITIYGNGKKLKVKVEHADDETVSFVSADSSALKEEKFKSLISAISQADTDGYARDLAPDASVGSDTVFSVLLSFVGDKISDTELKITHYSKTYDLVTLGDSSERLISVETTNKLTEALSEYLK